MYNFSTPLHTALRRFVVLFALAMLGFANSASATHSTGADLQYVWLGGTTYRITLNFYRDCAGINAPTAPVINIKGCSAAQTTSLTLTQLGAPTEVLPSCPTAGPSRCNGGTNVGIQRYTYSAVVTLNSTPCANWIFSFQHSARNNAITDIQMPGNQDLYVQAILNNVAVAGNNSSDFTTEPVPYICSGFPFTFNHGAFDADGDSLTYSMVTPMNGPNSTVAYLPGFSAANPLTTTPVNSTVFNTQNGQLTFTPNGTQQGIVAIIVREYRNGVLIGSTMRDMQVLVTAGGCNNSSPAFATPSAVTGGSFNSTSQTFRVCPGNVFSFTTTVSDPNAANILTTTFGGNLTGATVNISGTASTTGPRTITVSWSPTAADVGNHTISFQVRDNSCPTNGQGSAAFTVVVPGVEAGISRHDICLGVPRTFALNTTVYGGTTGTYLWTAVPAATFSSTSIANPTVTVSQPTVLTVQYTIGSCVVQDTVIVRAYSNLVLTPNNFTYCAGGAPVQLDANYVNNYLPALTHACGLYNGAPCTGAATLLAVGTGSITTNTGNNFGAGSPYQGDANARVQYIYTKAELNTAGIQAGILRKMAFFVSNKTGNFTYNGFTIKIKCIPVATTAFANGNDFATLPGAWTTVYVGSPASTLSWNEYTFTSPYDWDGVQNLAVEICYNIRETGIFTPSNNFDNVQCTNVGASRALYGYGGFNLFGSYDRCSDNSIDGRSNNRPNTRFDYCNNNSPNITYTWSPPAGLNATNIKNPTASPAGTGAHIYTVTATDGNCPQTATITVTTSPCNVCTANAGIVPLPTEITCANTSFVLNAAVSSPIITTGATPTTWAWSTNTGIITGGGTTPTPSIAAGGTYTVTMTNSVGGNTCTSTATINVAANNIQPIITIDTPTEFTCVTMQTTLNATASPASGNYTYNWGRSGGGTAGIVSGATTPNPLVNALGSYIVTVTNGNNGCTNTGSITVGQNITQPTVTIVAPTLLTCAQDTVVLNAAGSANGQEFSWFGPMGTLVGIRTGELSPTPTVTLIGTYIVTVTGGNGCTQTGSVTVGNNIVVPTPGVAPDGLLKCNTPNNVVSIGAQALTPNVRYDWSNDANIVTFAQDVAAGGTYTVTITSLDNGCSTTDVIVVTTDLIPPNVNVGLPQTLTCAVLSATLGGAVVPGVDYAWSSALGGGFTSANTVANPTVNVADTYTVQVLNPLNGCTSVASVVVSLNNTPPNANAGLPFELTCATPCHIIGVASTTTPVTYDWGGGIITPTRNICGIGTYTVTVTSNALAGGNGCTAVSSVIITENKIAPDASAGAGGVLTCATTCVTLGGSPTSTVLNASFDWNGNVVDIANPSVCAIGTYTVIVTNPLNGCTASSTAQVTNNLTAPAPNAGLSKTLNCTTLTVQIGTPAAANTTYAWSGSAGTVFVGGITNIAEPSVSEPGTYTVMATDGTTGCTAVSSVIIVQNVTAPFADAGLTQTVTCSNALTGVTIGGSPTSITPGATYSWSTALGTVSNPTNVLTAGFYTVTVTDPSNGCIKISSVEVVVNQIAPDANAGPDVLLTCTITNAVLTGNPTSTVPNATYVWCDGSTAPTRFVTIANIGTCTVTVTNPANGCTASNEVVVTLDDVRPDANAGPDKIKTCASPTVTLGITSTSQPVTYVWSTPPGGAGATIVVANTGTYTVTVTNTANGCTATDFAVVTQDLSPPVALAGANKVLNCTTLCENIGVVSTSPNVLYIWNNNATTAVQNVCAPGTYTVTVTNDPLLGGNGCSATDVVLVVRDIVQPNANAGLDAILTCASSSATIGVASTTPAVTYAWDGGTNLTGATQIINTAGTYCVTVTSQVNFCTKVDCVVVTNNTTQPLADAGPDVVLNCTNTNLQVGTPAIAGNTYDWTSSLSGSVGFFTAANQAQPRINRVGTYTVSVTNTINGCASTSEVIVTEDIALPNVNAGSSPQVLTCTLPDATLGQVSSTIGATYAWSGFPTLTTPTITVNLIGRYTVTVTGPNGCTASATVQVTQDKVLPNANAGLDKVITCTNSSVLIGVVSTTPNVNYAWSSPVGIGTPTQTVSPATPTTYTVTVTNVANGCTKSDAVNVTINVALPVANAGPTKELRCNQMTVQIGMTSPTPNVTYAWNNGAGTGAQPTVSVANTYTVTVMGQNGCTAISAVIVTQDTVKPNANAGPDKQIDCTTLTRQIGVPSTTAPHPVTYLWSNSPTTAQQTVNNAGIYTVTVTDTVNGCKRTDKVTVSANFTPPVAHIQQPSPITCVSGGVTLNASTSTPLTTRAFLWPDASTGSTFIAPTPNNYCVTVTNTANGCTASSCVSVINNIGGVQAVIIPTQTLTCLRNTVTLDACNSVPLGTAIVNWSPGVAACTTTTMAAGTYTVTITNPANGCTTTGSVTVIEDRQVPNANAGLDKPLTCRNTCVNVGLASTTAPVRYLWSNSGGVNPAASFCQTGTYTVTVTDLDNGCTASDEVVISLDTTPPNANAGTNQELTCSVDNVTLTATTTTTTGVSYQWGSSAGVLSATPTILVGSAGTYTVTVTSDVNGCSSISTVQVTLNRTPPNADAGLPQRIACNIPQVTLTGAPTSSTAGATFVWTGPTPTAIISDATLSSVDVNAGGVYVVTVRNPANGCTATDFVNVQADLLQPNANAGPDKEVNCTLQTSVTIGLPTPNVTYQWSTSLLDVSPYVTVSPTTTTTYTVTVTSLANGCADTDEVTVTANNAPPTIIIVPPAQLTCQVNTVELSAANSSPTGVIFHWSFGNSSNAVINVTAAGTYSVTVTNPLTGCSATSTVVVTQSATVPVLTETHTNVSCNGSHNGSIDVTMAGGRPPFRYIWSDNNGDEDRLGLAPGTYTTVITDANLCSIGTTVIITEPTRLTTNAVATPSRCANDGSVTTTTVGGTPPYTYQWGSIINSTTQSVPSLSAGDYYITVTDAKLCTATSLAIVTALFNIAPDTTVTRVRCAGGSDGQIQLAINGDNPPFTLQWSYANSIANPIIGLPAGNYRVTITDAIGCQAIKNYYMFQPEAMMAIPTLRDPKCNAACDGQIYLNMTGGNGGYVFSWGRAGEYSAYLNAVCAGTYSVTITDQKACTYSPAPYTLVQPDPVIIAPMLVVPTSCNGRYDGQLTAVASGGTPQYQYDWGSALGPVRGSLPVGTYTVTASDINGCTAFASGTVVEPPPIAVTLSVAGLNCTNDESGRITIDAVSGGNGGPYTYALNNAAQQQTMLFAGLNPGNYNIHVFDVNGCEIIEQRLIRTPSPLIIDGGGPFTIQMGDSVKLSPQVSGAFNPLYEYTWTAIKPGTNASITNPTTLATYVHPLLTTTYQVQVRDAARGCVATDRVLVEVVNPLNVYIPNIFTPDGNGLNDYFMPFAGLGIEKIVVMRVFDRWGDLVFENNNFLPNVEKSGWDGTFKGQKMNPNTYVYFIEIELSDGKKQVFSGSVNLMR
jgi:gliding motility-associated-like protein